MVTSQPKIMLAVLLLTAPVWAGCLSSDAGGITVPRPAVDSTVTYEGEHGRRLVIVVTDVESRQDHRMVSHESVILTADLRHSMYGADGEWSTFQEAVDLAEGLVVHHVAVCARPLLEAEGCYDNRSAVAFGSSGLPGGLLLGPLWGMTLPPSGLLNVTSRASEGQAQIPYTIEPVREDRACIHLQIPDGSVEDTQFPLEIVEAVACDGSAFPTEFVEADGTRYERIDASTRAGTIDPSPLTGWTGTGQASELRPWSTPLVVQDPSDPADLTVEEAHREALDQNEAYRSFFEDRDSMVIGTQVRPTGSASVEGVEQELQRAYERTLIGVDSEGAAVSIVVEEDTTAGQMSDYRVSEFQTHSFSNGTSPADLPDQVLAVGPALELGDELVGTDRQGFHAAWPSTPAHPYLAAGNTPYPDGFVFFAMYDQPSEGGGSGGVSVQKPAYLVMDGSTGNLLLFETHSSNLPFG